MEKVYSDVLENNYVSSVAKDLSTNRIIGVGTAFLEVSFSKLSLKSWPTMEFLFQRKPKSKEEGSEYDRIKEKHMKSENCKKLLNVFKYISSKVDIFEKYDIDCYLQLGHLITLPEYRIKKVGSEMNNFIMEWFNEWHANPEKAYFIPEHLRFPPPQLCAWLLTSKYSQRIDRESPFVERLKTFSYKDFSLNGKSFADRVGDQDLVAILGVTKPFKNSKL